jgi:FMN phosphatase YigB (HAD superfamily)
MTSKDDSYSSDIAGAKAAGIDRIWIHEGETDETAIIYALMMNLILLAYVGITKIQMDNGNR